MNNEILIALHVMTAIFYGVTLTSAIEKRQYIRPFTEILIFIFSGLGIVMLVRELIMMNYDLAWVFPQWYFVRIISCIVTMIFINRINRLKNNNQLLRNENQRLRDKLENQKQ